MWPRGLQYGVGFFLILALVAVRLMSTTPPSQSTQTSAQVETVAQQLHRGDPLSFLYTALDNAQGWRDSIPSTFDLQGLVQQGSVSLSKRLLGPLPLPDALPSTTVNGFRVEPVRLDRLDSYLRELFFWAM
ncbi:MAG: hypothetical protein EPO21_07830 [Chloroflexota bacterium]|nr:MAG: hypothetical protein EPO21_07830 [Chloroflexota bacterium]